MLGFRVWDVKRKKMITHNRHLMTMRGHFLYVPGYGEPSQYNKYDCPKSIAVPMQSTGLKDREGLTEVYEGDIININGLMTGNIYENEPRETDLIVQRLGKKIGHAAIQEAMARGCFYSE